MKGRVNGQLNDMDRPVILYDADCRFCRFSARAVARVDRRDRLAFLPFADEAAGPLLTSLPGDERHASWHLARSDGGVVSGGAAVSVLLATLGYERLARIAARRETLIERLYRRVAAHRRRFGRVVPDGPAPRRFP